MVKTAYSKLEVKIPSNINAQLKDMVVEISGPLGSMSKDFSHAKQIKISKTDNKIILDTLFPDKKKAALLGTIKSHIQNMIDGVTHKFRYEMKIVYAHFPVNVEFDSAKRVLLIKNFLGERSDRRARVLEGVDVQIEEDNIILEGVDKEKIGQSAANIQRATRIRKKDPRIFGDGIYVYRKYVGDEIEWKII
ncbi:MAG: 50S ribosomal protein L6 [Candidatus Jordarchaeum sp.]|uniref:50S ribosomal protein L6 n=1 Tax=Candidatus Jordarchaeum sp. TaxID=2823881 RepID=UPI00404ABD68